MNTMKEKEVELLRHLRQNSRKPLSKISKETSIPTSTLFELLKKLENTVITKHTSLIDYSKLGYNLKINFAIKTQQKQQLKQFLMTHKNVNSLFSSINDHDFYVECIFKDLMQVIEFREQLEQYNVKDIQETHIVEEIKKEGFNV